MKSKFYTCLFIIILFIGTHVYGSSVVILMAQHDDDKEALRETTYLLENGIMDILFEGGYIVSSLPSNINIKVEANTKQSILRAKEGFMSYVVFVTVNYYSFGMEYDESITLDDIESINISIVRTSDSAIIHEVNNIEPQKNEGETDLLAVKRFSGELGFEIKNILDRGEK